MCWIWNKNSKRKNNRIIKKNKKNKKKLKLLKNSNKIGNAKNENKKDNVERRLRILNEIIEKFKLENDDDNENKI